MKLKRTFAVLLAVCLLAGCCSAFAIDAGQSRAVIGADLSADQIDTVYKTFGISRGDVTELTVTNAEERQYLDGLVDSSIIGTRSISCVYIETLDSGKGLDVTTSNTSWCTKDMYVNALVTAGIDDAKVVVTAPWSVSGTAALTGIYKAYEDITGQKLDENAKQAGTQELVVTADLADQIGSYDAVTIVNELKLILSDTKNMTDAELRDKIVEIADQYGVSLSDSEISQLISLCRSLEGLSTEDLQAKVESIQNTLKKVAGVKEAAGGFVNTVKNFFASVGSFFANIFSKKS